MKRNEPTWRRHEYLMNVARREAERESKRQRELQYTKLPKRVSERKHGVQ